jgi:hypothetical protein
MVLGTIQTASLVVGIVYYLTIMRNNQRTRELSLKAQEQAERNRQAQLLYSLFETFRSLEFRKLWHQVMVYDWKDYDDWYERYDEKTNPDAIAAFSSVMLFFEGIGVLVRKGLINIGIVNELLGIFIKMTWERYEPVFLGDRRDFPMVWRDFEFLYESIQEPPYSFLHFTFGPIL